MKQVKAANSQHLLTLGPLDASPTRTQAHGINSNEAI